MHFVCFCIVSLEKALELNTKLMRADQGELQAALTNAYADFQSKIKIYCRK